MLGVLCAFLIYWDAQAQKVSDPLLVEPIPDVYVPVNASRFFDLDRFLSDTTISVTPGFNSTRLSVVINQTTHVVAITSVGNEIGTEIIEFVQTGLDSVIGRMTVIVFRPPVIIGLPDTTIAAGRKGAVLNLDHYFSAGPPDSVMWTVKDTFNIRVNIDTTRHTATLTAPTGWMGTERVTFLVLDRFGEIGRAIIAITAVIPGPPPVLAPFPIISLFPGGVDTSISLDAYVFDPDTDDSAIDWILSESHLVSTGIDTITKRPLTRRLRISAPFGVAERKEEEIVLTARDPTFSDTSATLTVIVLPDTTPPTFTISFLTNPVLRSTILVSIVSSEELNAPPEVEVDGVPLSVNTLSQVGVAGQVFSGVYNP